MQDIKLSTKKIVDDGITHFIARVMEDMRKDFRSLRMDPPDSDYPVFRPVNREFFEFRYYENRLEWHIRDYLITKIISGLFDANNIECYMPEEPKTIIRPSFDNEEYGRVFEFALLFTENGKRIGCRYSDWSYEQDEKIKKLVRKMHLDLIEIIDWDDSDSDNDLDKIVTDNQNEVIHYSLRQFFSKHFSDSIYNYYIKASRAAVKKACELIGYETKSTLSQPQLSDFKQKVRDNLRLRQIRELKYKELVPGGQIIKLPEVDCQAIERRVIEDGFYKALCGRSNFATCFLTAEYQFYLFDEYKYRCFDYTSVAVGYFKSVELLLESVMEAVLKYGNKENLKIKHKDRYKKPIPFTEENKKNFSTELSSLINFITSNSKGWLITENGKKTVRDILNNYKDQCRNEHLHKEIISDVSPTLKTIRENTITCLYYILGSCRLSSDNESDYCFLQIEDDSYERLYRSFSKLPRGVYRFYLQFEGASEIMAVRKFEQDPPMYDEYGNIVSDVKFFLVDSFENCDENVIKNNRMISVSRDNIPKKVYWYSKYTDKEELEW